MAFSSLHSFTPIYLASPPRKDITVDNIDGEKVNGGIEVVNKIDKLDSE